MLSFRSPFFLFFLLDFSAVSNGLASQLPPDEAWLDDAVEEQIAAVNEGDLVFLTAPTAVPVHHHHSHVVLTPTSLLDGWTRMQQCHENLDKVAQAQIVYTEDSTRNLEITSVSNIRKAWVEGKTVQLEDVGPNARLCIQVQSRNLRSDENQRLYLRNGPFMRRFLDGYYPMHVSLSLVYPGRELHLIESSPEAQAGFRVWEDQGRIHYETWFEGRLFTELSFSVE